jgi:hypothetical protein
MQEEYAQKERAIQRERKRENGKDEGREEIENKWKKEKLLEN